MSRESARALTGTATLVLFAGFLVPSPSGAFFAYGLAALLSAVPTILGTGRMRLIAAILLLCSVALAADKCPDFRSEQERYRQRSKASRVSAIHAWDSGATARA